MVAKISLGNGTLMNFEGHAVLYTTPSSPPNKPNPNKDHEQDQSNFAHTLLFPA